MIEFAGKILVRRAKTHDGKECLSITGVVIPSVPVEQFDDRDEMWAVKLVVIDHVAFVNSKGLHFSPEDFLEIANGEMDAKNWERKS